MAASTLKLQTWPLPLRWVVAMIVVPVLPFAVVAALSLVFLSVGLDVPGFIFLAITYAALLCIPAAWLCFVPTYVLIDRWGRHSKASYVKGAVLAVFIAAGLIFCVSLLMGLPPQGFGSAIFFGLVVALPSATIMASLIWHVLWSGREPDDGAV